MLLGMLSFGYALCDWWRMQGQPHPALIPFRPLLRAAARNMVFRDDTKPMWTSGWSNDSLWNPVFHMSTKRRIVEDRTRLIEDDLPDLLGLALRVCSMHTVADIIHPRRASCFL